MMALEKTVRGNNTLISFNNSLHALGKGFCLCLLPLNNLSSYNYKRLKSFLFGSSWTMSASI